MQKTISGKDLAAAVLATVLSGGLLFLPVGLAFAYVLCQRREELQRKELDDAKNY